MNTKRCGASAYGSPSFFLNVTNIVSRHRGRAHVADERKELVAWKRRSTEMQSQDVTAIQSYFLVRRLFEAFCQLTASAGGHPNTRHPSTCPQALQP